MSSRSVTAWFQVLGILAGLACVPAPVSAQPAVLQAPDEAGHIRALLVGIDAYRHVRPLKGAISDARDIEGALRRSGITDVTVLLDERVHPGEGVLQGAERLDDRRRGPPVVRREHQIGTGDGYRGRHAAHTPFAAAGWSTTASDRPFVAIERHGRFPYGRGSPL